MGDLLSLLILLLIGYVFGTFIEKSHFNSLSKRERIYLNLPTVTTEKMIDKNAKIRDVQLVYGSAVISSTFLKILLQECEICWGLG